jgi:flagellar hook protein FlgE
MMFSVNSSQSAVLAYGKRMGVHASRVANAYSDGFKRSQAIQAILKEDADHEETVEIDCIDSTEYSVLETSEDQTDHSDSNTDLSEPSTVFSESNTENNEPDNVDLAAEVVEIKICHRGYEANLSFINTEDEMAGTILDLLS